MTTIVPTQAIESGTVTHAAKSVQKYVSWLMNAP